MAPIRIMPKGSTFIPTAARKTTAMTKSKASGNTVVNDQNIEPISKKTGKRKADHSPDKQLAGSRLKRSALGNLTNAVINRDNDTKKILANKKQTTTAGALKKSTAATTTTTAAASAAAVSLIKSSKLDGYGFAAPRPTKVMTRAAARAHVVPTTSVLTVSQASSKSSSNAIKCDQDTVVKAKESIAAKVQPKPNATTRRISNEFEKTEDSLYETAFEDFSSAESIRKSPIAKEISKTTRRSIVIKSEPDENKNISDNAPASAPASPEDLLASSTSPPPDVCDFDKENWNDQFQVSHYAMDVFNYLKSRESHFPISDYMPRQRHLSVWMRTLLVDWMVEVQETFELNHETLYLAVKLVDMYMGIVLVVKENLQLLGAAALLIACKYDERTPPLIDDFLYICDNAYKKDELITMEMDLFRTIGFDLSIPLSYRFLRRYARVSKVTMPILTLARYILEFSLMDYTTITFSDSQMACASLFIALRMNKKPGWDKTLEYYSGYTLKDFANIVPILNAGLHQKPRETIKTVRHKYSHKIFFEVAKIPLLKTDQLFEDSGFIVKNK